MRPSNQVGSGFKRTRTWVRTRRTAWSSLSIIRVGHRQYSGFPGTRLVGTKHSVTLAGADDCTSRVLCYAQVIQITPIFSVRLCPQIQHGEYGAAEGLARLDAGRENDTI